ncbi:MAG: diaminopimelate epimerase [Pseudomonadota bacterium]
MDTVQQFTPLRFRKMHGAGNDFVIVDARDGGLSVTPALARALGERHRGVGFDQLAVLAEVEGADIGVTFWNGDGSQAAACGNASRCIVALMLAEGRGPHVSLAVTGRAEPLTGRRRDDGLITVDMGEATADWRAIPLAEAVDTDALPLEGAPVAVGIGNPHCVHFVEDVEAVDLAARGAAVEHHPLFPERTNVQFAQVLSRDSLRVRVWERGAGATLASGSSACAVAVAGTRRGLTDARVAVHLPGGTLEIALEGTRVHMAGPVAEVFEGTLSPAFLDAVLRP